MILYTLDKLKVISRRRGRYTFIRFFDWYSRCVAPLSLLYCSVLATNLSPAHWLPLALELFVVAEAAFYFFIFLPGRYLTATRTSSSACSNPCKKV